MPVLCGPMWSRRVRSGSTSSGRPRTAVPVRHALALLHSSAGPVYPRGPARGTRVLESPPWASRSGTRPRTSTRRPSRSSARRSSSRPTPAASRDSLRDRLGAGADLGRLGRRAGVRHVPLVGHQLTVPGGQQLPAAAVAAVRCSRPTAGAGSCTDLAAHEHAALRERGEAVGPAVRLRVHDLRPVRVRAGDPVGVLVDQRPGRADGTAGPPGRSSWSRPDAGGPGRRARGVRGVAASARPGEIWRRDVDLGPDAGPRARAVGHDLEGLAGPPPRCGRARSTATSATRPSRPGTTTCPTAPSTSTSSTPSPTTRTRTCSATCSRSTSWRPSSWAARRERERFPWLIGNQRAAADHRVRRRAVGAPVRRAAGARGADVRADGRAGPRGRRRRALGRDPAIRAGRRARRGDLPADGPRGRPHACPSPRCRGRTSAAPGSSTSWPPRLRRARARGAGAAPMPCSGRRTRRGARRSSSRVATSGRPAGVRRRAAVERCQQVGRRAAGRRRAGCPARSPTGPATPRSPGACRRAPDGPVREVRGRDPPSRSRRPATA